MTTIVRRMRCTNPEHRALLVIPATHEAVNGEWIVDRSAPYKAGRPASPAAYLRHEHCGRAFKGVAVTAKVTATPCRARCTDAIGFDCECECGGEHHGENARG